MLNEQKTETTSYDAAGEALAGGIQVDELRKADEAGASQMLERLLQKLDEAGHAGEEPTIQVKKSYAGCLLSLFVGLSLLLATGFVCFYYFVSQPTAETGEQMIDRFAGALSSVFGTDVKISGSTVMLEKSEIGELALVQRKTQAITKYQTSWWGSENMLIVRGDFIVKAGFDLSEGGHWGLLDGKVEGPIPKAKVLSVEPYGPLEVYYSENGIINHLSPEDQAAAFNLLIHQARRDARRSGLAEEAEEILLRRINDRMGGPEGQDLEWDNLP